MEGCDFVIHAAALKQITVAEYNPMECIKTNIIGAQNLIESALDLNINKIVALSTDKAVAPVNLYGATKLCAEKLFIAANYIKGEKKTIFSIVRYGNVMGSRGSVIPLFLKKKELGEKLPITHPEMTRFNFLLDEAVDLVFYALKNSLGGEIYVPKMPSYKILDLAKAIDPKGKFITVGIRPGEKLHEEMVSTNETPNTVEFKKYYAILPQSQFLTWSRRRFFNITKARKVKGNFRYTSDNNKKFLTITEIQNLIKHQVD
jgi:FlaA1/EpsC-like NDP-sugar epimerase